MTPATSRIHATAAFAGWRHDRVRPRISGLGFAHGDTEGLWHRDRIRHRRARGRQQSRDGVVVADQRVRQRNLAQGRLGLRGRDAGERRTRVQPRRCVPARDRNIPGQCGALQRRPLLRRPRTSGDLDPRGHHGGGGGPLGPCRRRDRAGIDALRRRHPRPRCRADRVQEQLRRQGQQLRLSRELPVESQHAVRPDRQPHHAAFRDTPDLLRGGQSRL